MLGFRDRQLRCEGETNRDNRYANKVVGNSPEICRGLDSHGFADLKRMINWSIAVSSIYGKNDPRKFNNGTPAELWSSITRAWEICPTSERIIEDIKQLPQVLQKIIDHNGTIVPDEILRSGRRYESIKGGKKELKSKPRNSQRKETIKQDEIHPDCIEAYNMIKSNIIELQPFVDDIYNIADDIEFVYEHDDIDYSLYL